MRNGIRLAVAAGVLAATALVLASTAFAAYTSATLKVTQAGTRTTIAASVQPADVRTARIAIYAPAGTTIKTDAAPGATVGTVTAQIAAHLLGGAIVPLAGEVKVAPPGAVTATQISQCAGAVPPTVIWLMSLTAAGQTLNVPIYVVPTAGPETAIGPAKLVACFSASDVQPQSLCASTLCAQFLSATLSFNGIFTAPAAGAWIAFWTPYQPLNGQVDAAGTAATPAAVAPGAVTAKARKVAKQSVVTGKVTQGGQGRGGLLVRVFQGATRGSLKSVGSVRAKADGSYTFRSIKKGLFFQARVVAPAAAAPPLCTAIQAQLGGVACLNPQVSGFTAQSAVTRRPA